MTQPQPRTEPLAPGTHLGRYELIRLLAVGGMAEVYLARATGIEGFEKLLVLKRILPRFADDAEHVAMFLDEARLAARLSHPNIGQVYDIGAHEGSYFFTMEYIHGEDARTLVKTCWAQRKRLPLEQAVAIVAGAAAGLHAAHETRGVDGRPQGVVHRDVSLSNVVVTYDGCVKIIDFGIAKAEDRESETRTGCIKGKASYMSPEQCRGEEIDRRSDIFSLGIILYELTTMHRLFTGTNEFTIMQKVVAGEIVPPSVRVSDYPPELETIVLRALEADRNRRYATAEEMQVDLDAVARAHGFNTSQVGLGRLMRKIFAERLDSLPVRDPRRSDEMGTAAYGQRPGTPAPAPRASDAVSAGSSSNERPIAAAVPSPVRRVRRDKTVPFAGAPVEEEIRAVLEAAEVRSQSGTPSYQVAGVLHVPEAGAATAGWPLSWAALAGALAAVVLVGVSILVAPPEVSIEHSMRSAMRQLAHEGGVTDPAPARAAPVERVVEPAAAEKAGGEEPGPAAEEPGAEEPEPAAGGLEEADQRASRDAPPTDAPAGVPAAAPVERAAPPAARPNRAAHAKRAQAKRAARARRVRIERAARAEAAAKKSAARDKVRARPKRAERKRAGRGPTPRDPVVDGWVSDGWSLDSALPPQ